MPPPRRALLQATFFFLHALEQLLTSPAQLLSARAVARPAGDARVVLSIALELWESALAAAPSSARDGSDGNDGDDGEERKRAV